MEQQIPILTKMILLLFALIGIAQFGFALRTFVMEKREGMALSSKRLITVSVTSGLLVLTAVFSLTAKSLLPAAPSGILLPGVTKDVPAGASLESDRSGKLWAKLTGLKNEIKHLGETVGQFKSEIKVVGPAKELAIKSEIPKLEKAVDQLKTTVKKISEELGAFPKKTAEPIKKPDKPEMIKDTQPRKQRTPGNTLLNWLLLISALMMLSGTLSLFLIGDRRNLFISKRPRPITTPRKNKPDPREIPSKPLEPLDRLARLIDKEQYEAALDLAKEIEKSKLKELDRMDFSYLKSFCIVMILMPYYLEVTKGTSNLPPLSPERKEALVSEAVEELSEMRARAPRNAEAQYLLGIVLTFKKKYREALELFNKAQNRLRGEESLKYIKSLCLLTLAGDLLSKADQEGANKLFDEVVSLKVLKDRIPGVFVANRLLNIMKSYKESRFEEARQGLVSIAKIEGVNSDQKKAIEIILGALEIMILFTEKSIKKTVKNTANFLEKWTPADLPEPGDQTADEILSPVAGKDDLPFPVSIFRAFYFLQAVVMLQLREMKNKAPGKEETQELALPLLRALQFEPRDRELLACLGALYVLFLPDKREKALEWLDAADIMGIESEYIRSLLEKYRSIEVERKHILERFRTLTTRFLADGSVNADIKRELAKELGQFHEFRPILIELGDLGEIQQKSPTLQSLLNRAQYLCQLSKDLSQSEIIAGKKQILSISREYDGLVKVIQSVSTKLEAFEKQLMKEIGKQVLQ